MNQDQFLQGSINAHYLDVEMANIPHPSGKTFQDHCRSAQLEYTYVRRDLRNVAGTLRDNERTLTTESRINLKLLCVLFGLPSATTQIIPEGHFNGTNGLYPQTHTWIHLHNWECRDKHFTSIKRLNTYLRTIVESSSKLDNEDAGIHVGHMRSFKKTLTYGTKGYGHSDQIPEVALKPVTVKLTDYHRHLKVTPGEGSFSKDFALFREFKLSLSAKEYKAFKEDDDIEHLYNIRQYLYDLELAHKRDARRRLVARKAKASKPKKPVVTRSTSTKESGFSLDEIVEIYETPDTYIEQIQVGDSMRRLGVSEKAIRQAQERIRRQKRPKRWRPRSSARTPVSILQNIQKRRLEQSNRRSTLLQHSAFSTSISFPSFLEIYHELHRSYVDLNE